MPDDIWMLGLALGLAVDAGLLLGLVLSGAPVRLPADLPRLATIGAAVAALGWTGLPVLVGLARGGWAALWAWKMRPWAQQAEDAAQDRHAAPPHATREEPAEPDSEARAWASALSRFFRAGDLAGGFSIRKLEGVIGSDAWARLTEFYSSEAGNRVLRVGPGDQGTVWNWGWDVDYVLQRISAGGFPFPSGPVPTVEVYVQSAATPRNATRQRKTAARVVDGTAKAAE